MKPNSIAWKLPSRFPLEEWEAREGVVSEGGGRAPVNIRPPSVDTEGTGKTEFMFSQATPDARLTGFDIVLFSSNAEPMYTRASRPMSAHGLVTQPMELPAGLSEGDKGRYWVRADYGERGVSEWAPSPVFEWRHKVWKTAHWWWGEDCA